MRDWIESLFNKHKLVRRTLLVWACWIITYTAFVFFDHVATLTAPAATVMVSIVGLLSVVIGLYQWSRNKDDSI